MAKLHAEAIRKTTATSSRWRIGYWRGEGFAQILLRFWLRTWQRAKKKGVHHCADGRDATVTELAEPVPPMEDDSGDSQNEPDTGGSPVAKQAKVLDRVARYTAVDFLATQGGLLWLLDGQAKGI